MTNLDFLKEGQIFPPLSEAKRIGAIADYNLMFDGNTYAVEEKHFKETLKNLNKLAVLLGWTDSYVAVEYNYFKLLSKKTADFVCGEIPDITATNASDAKRKKEQAVLDDIRTNTQFDLKHYDAWLDVSKYGEEYLRIYTREKKNTFTLQSPAMIIRITDEEDDYEVKNYVVAWLSDNCKVLKVQIHYKGYYIVRSFSVETCRGGEPFVNQKRYESANIENNKSDIYSLVCDRYTDEIFRCSFFRIKQQLKSDEKVNTGLDDFAIVPLTGIMDAERDHGVSDYDDISSIVSQMQRTMTQVQLIFDKYTTPTMGVPVEALTECEQTGENIVEIGRAIGIPENGVMPQFIEPDLTKLEMYFRQLEFSIARIKELSEMGAAFNADSSVGNVAVETMKATYTSAIKKAERLTTKNTDNIKRLFHLISMVGYDCIVPVEDIQITWYDGLPNDEEKDVRIANTKVQGGLSSRKAEYQNRFNGTEEGFDDMWTQLLQEENDMNSMRAVGSMFNPFETGGEKGANDGEKGKDDQTGDNDQDGGTQGKTPPTAGKSDEGDETDE
ncbi:MAG: phage portal protein [Clostridia bacterium]|nr:phage portal protein [Clostridia bacterium]